MEKLKKKVTIVLMAIMMTMVFFADAQAKAGCNHKHTGRTWIIAEKANCNHTGRKKQLCVRCRKVLLEKVIPKTKHRNVNAVEKEKFLITINNEDMR